MREGVVRERKIERKTYEDYVNLQEVIMLKEVVMPKIMKITSKSFGG
uniref:Uncharacterized protein n=1 Tax=Vitis vinifera TaxID=29760 RepID=F6HSL9_VITVI